MATPLLPSPSDQTGAGRLRHHSQQQQQQQQSHPPIVMTTTTPTLVTSPTSSSLRHHHETSLDDEDEISTSQHLSTTTTAATVTKTTTTRREHPLQHQQQQTVYSDASTTYSRPDTLSFTISMSGKTPTTEKVKSKNDSPTSLDSALASSRGTNSSVRHHPSRSRVSGSKASFSSRRSSSSSDSSESDFEHLDMCPTVKPKLCPSSSPPPISSNNRPCNRYGWFIDSDEAQVEEQPIPSEVIMRREAKWIEMTSSHRKWNKYVTKRFKTLRKRCHKGIPHSIRARAWFYLCGGHKTLDRQQGLFDQLDSLPGDENINQEISKDLHRQFPSHEIFATRDGSGQQDLFRILKAYSILKPEVGYCQGQAPLAAVLLMIMPAEHAFISLSNLCDLYLQGYFDPGLETLQLHGDMLFSLIRRYHSSAHKLLKKQNIEPVLYMTEWFMCLFSRTLPWPVVLRVWDMFMCEGIIIVFKVAIVLVGSVIDGERKSCKSMYDTLQLLKHPPQKYLTEQFLLARVNRLDLTETDLKREHAIQSNNRRIKQIAEEKRKLNAMKEAEKGRQASSSRASPSKNGGIFHASSNNSHTRSSRSPSKQNASSSGMTSPSAVNRSQSGSVNQTHMVARKTISSPPNIQQDNDSQRYIRESSMRKTSSHVSPSPSSHHHSQRRSSPAPRDTFRVVREHQKERSPPKYVR